MAEATQLMFDHKEIVELLIKKAGIREGIWALSIEFGLGAQAVPVAPDGKTLMPAVIGTVQRIGLKQHEGELNNLSLDAATVNSGRAGGSKKRAKK